MKNANLVSGGGWRGGKALATMVFALFLAGCDDSNTTKPTSSAPDSVKTVADYFAIKVGDQTTRMQLAVERPDGDMRELSHGLMGRRDLADDQGMLFIYRQVQQMTFYMRNTPTPLDIGFFSADGVLTEVRQMFPFDETTVFSARSDIQCALEMNQGWFERHGVRPGAKIDLKALGEALKARGFEPQQYGIR